MKLSGFVCRHSGEGERTQRSLKESLLALKPFWVVVEIKEVPSAGDEHRMGPEASVSQRKG